MKPTWLVQRLLTPLPKTYLAKKHPFIPFGGGIPLGGFTYDAWKRINNVFAFDYMCATQYERGAVPTAIRTIVLYNNSGNAVTGQVKLAKPVFYLCEKDMRDEVITRIKGMVKETVKLRDYSFLKETLKKNNTNKRDIGWLELDNGFIFFVDERIFRKSLDMFAEISLDNICSPNVKD
jgi:hypothetical protein